MAESTAAAVAHLRPNRRVRARFSKVASARDTIRGFGHDMDVAGLTFGQFSLIDLIQAALEIAGPADVTISTWSAGFYDIEAAERFRDDGLLRSIRFVMDAASMKRGQASVYDIADLFGKEAIRTTRTHAKFALIRNDEWSIVITSSMNLNLNPRCEQFEMTDDPERCGMFAAFVDALFDELPAGGAKASNGDQALPALHGLPAVQPDLGIAVGVVGDLGRVGNLGRVSIGRDAG